jgi:hypothetical protein
MILSEKSATFRDHALILRMILSEKSATFRDHASVLRMILSEKSATFRDRASVLRMILSEKSATFRDHARERRAKPPAVGSDRETALPRRQTFFGNPYRSAVVMNNTARQPGRPQARLQAPSKDAFFSAK